MRQFLAVIPLFVALMIVSGCTSDPLDTGTNPIDSNAYRLKGTLSGRTALQDYKFPAQPLSSITISIDGTNFKTNPDSTGWWSFKDLPSGIYTLTFTKEGFAPYKLFNQQFVGGGELVLGIIKLARIPTEYTIVKFQLDSLYTYGPNKYLSFAATASDSLPAGLGIKAFVVNDTSFDATLYSFDGTGHMGVELNFSQETRNYVDEPGIYVKNLYDMGFRSGDQLFAFAHIIHQGYPGYSDPYLGTVIRPAISPLKSNVVSFVLP
jgi:hypothetical protein